MNVIFVGSLFPPNFREQIESNSKGTIQYAADAFQWNFVNGLNENLSSDVNLISAPIVGSFPFFYSEIKINSSEFSYIYNDKKHQGRSICFYNFPIIKNFFIRKNLESEIKSHIVNNDDNIIIIYGMLAPWVLATVNIKKQFNNIKLCLVIPDLPQYMNNSTSIFSKLRNLFLENLYKYIPMFDGFILMTNQMSSFLNITDKPFLVIEGMVDSENISKKTGEKITRNKIVMYSGTLAQRYGVLNLVHAFRMISDNSFELWICGEGDSKAEIEKNTLEDQRIKYLGQMSRNKVLELQNQATVLVNPRTSDGEYTKYSFPSKTMEYLLSGTPCIMYRLPGIPKAYDDYLYYVEDNRLDSLKNKIIEICNLDSNSLAKFGERGRNFVLKNKNNIVQTEKMVLMFNKLIKKD